MAKLPPKDTLLNNQWKTFYSAEPRYQYRAKHYVSFPTSDTIRFATVALFSELGLGDDIEVVIESPVTVSDVFFTVPKTIKKTEVNPQGQSASLTLTGTNYGFVLEWGSRRMFMLGRAYEPASS